MSRWVGCQLVVVLFLMACASTSKTESAERPTVSIFGFSCELGGKKCRDRRVGRDMRTQVLQGVKKLGRFRPMREDPKLKKHLLDVSDMLWTSGESEVSGDLANLVTSDYLIYGRVYAYDSETRKLKVELTLMNRVERDSLSVQGEGQNGDMTLAVNDALHNLEMAVATRGRLP